MATEYPPIRRAMAWGVHFYTALGLPLAVLACVGLVNHDARLFFMAQIVACFVDATDGMMARKVNVKEVTPDFNGRKLDDLVDFIHFSFLPSLAIIAFGLFPPGWEPLAVVPLMASAYGFCQEAAKTEESFVGFPSYWNIMVLYLYVLGTAPHAAAASILLFSALVFVPIHYVYPTRTVWMRSVTLGFGSLWAVTMTVIAFSVDEPWARTAALFTLVFPLYYAVLSLAHHHRVHQT